MKRVAMIVVAFSLSLAFVAWTGGAGGVLAQDKKKEKDPMEGKKGTVIGALVAKEKNWIEVKADGEEKGRKYVPHWVGGAPSAGGGPDKKMLEIFGKLKVGSRIEVQWEYEERLRAVAVKVLKEPAPKEKDGK